MNLVKMCFFITVGFLFLILNFQEIYHGIVDRFGDSLSSNSTDGSNLQRTLTISLIWNHMFDNGVFNLFFGYGAGTVSDFMFKHPLLIEDFGTTDNQYLSWLYEFGLIGVLFYLSLLLFIVLKFFSNRNRHWTIELSFLSFIVISFELIFFEGWPVVYVMLSFLIAILTFHFRTEDVQ